MCLFCNMFMVDGQINNIEYDAIKFLRSLKVVEDIYVVSRINV